MEINSTYINFFVGIVAITKETKAFLANLHEVNIALFKRLSTWKRLPLSLTSPQCNHNALLGPAQPFLRTIYEACYRGRFEMWKIKAHLQRSVRLWRSEPNAVGRFANTSFPLKSASMLWSQGILKTIGDALQCTFEIYLIDHHFEYLAPKKYEPCKFWSA